MLIRSFFLKEWVSSESPNLRFLLVSRIFSILPPFFNFYLQFFIRDNFRLLQWLSGKRVNCAMKKMLLEVTEVNNLTWKSDWVLHFLNDNKNTVKGRAHMYFTGSYYS